MCGFNGTFLGNISLSKEMTPLNHRGPDDTDFFEDENIYFRHYRLAILGNQKDGKQPMFSFNKKILLLYNGEIYNYKELALSINRPDLIHHGDSRVLVELLSQKGLGCLSKLNGMFSMVIYFRDKKEIVLLRDRFGIKPLYYIFEKGVLYFASEIKSLKKVSQKIEFDPNKVINFLENAEYPFGENTFYKKIKQLEGGTFLKMDKHTKKIHRWFSLKDYYKSITSNKLSFSSYEELLDDSMKLRIRSDVPISLHYSSGTDSTALLIKFKKFYGKTFPVSTFTMAYDQNNVDESGYAEKYCKILNVKNNKVYLSASEVPELSQIVNNSQDEPYAGIPVISYYKMNQIEKELGFKVSIEGQGGDESFGGYLYHIYLAIYDLYKSGKDKEILNLILSVNNLELNEVIKKSEKLIENGFNSHTDLTDLKKNRKNNKIDLFIDWLTTIQIYDILINKIPRTLRFHDRASMAFGREVRFPLLDHRVITYGLAMNTKLKFKDGISKAPLRYIIKNNLKNVYKIPKRSVVTPQTDWLRSDLKSWAIERIEILKNKHIIPSKFFRYSDEFFLKNTSNNSFKVWQLINLSFKFE